jgi:putative transposase
MTLAGNDTQSDQLGQADLQSLLREKMRQAVRLTLNTILEEEVEAFVGAGRYQRTGARRDQRNGHYSRGLVTGVGEIEALPVPRTRKGFQSQVFQRYKRRQAELDEAICNMFVQGISMAHVGEVLAEHYVYAFADGTYFSVIYNGAGHKMPILAVVGINAAGQREVLGFTVGERENQAAWEDLCDDLKRRGVQQVDLWITDGNPAMINALELKFFAAQRQRCVKHKMENVLSYVPQSQREMVKPELRAIFYQENREKADQELFAFCEKFGPLYPSAVACLKRDLEACLTFYAFPRTHWKTIRTTNVLERTFGEVKKRSHKMAAAFRNENSCLLMFYAVIRTLRFQNLRMPAQEPVSTILHKT